MNTLFDELPEEQRNKPKDMKSLMGNYQLGKKKTKHEYEYQEVCSDLQKMFEDHGNEAESKLVWTLPYKVGFTPHKIKKAGEIARKRGIIKFSYVVGIIKNLPDW